MNRRGQINNNFKMPKTAGERYNEARNLPPEISAKAAHQVSDYRRAQLEEQIYQGQFREQGALPANLSGYPVAAGVADEAGQTKLGAISYTSTGKKALASSASSAVSSAGGGSSGWRGSNDTSRQIPEVYSPLWLHSNLNLPRDRATVNAWSRSFFALNPFVHNAITLHSTYPISKLNIKCSDPKVEQFFAEMCEEIDLMEVCVAIAQEYWTLGEAFVYAELDERQAKWSRIHIQNPDYITVKRSVIAGEPIISLRPDEQLKQIVFGQKPSDIQQRQQLDPSIIEHVKRGQNIPLDNFYVSHLARRIAPYEVRGTGLIVNCFRSLMRADKLTEAKFAQADNQVNPLTLVKIGGQDVKPTPQDLEQWRNVFEQCHDEETEVLTDQGFKRYDEVIEFVETMDGTTDSSFISHVRLKDNYKIACFNHLTEQLEYHAPTNIHLSNYIGDMYHFKARNMDVKVTPDHDMWVKKHRRLKSVNTYSDWKKIKAKDISNGSLYRTRATVKFNGIKPETVSVLGKEIPTELYLKFLGYLISEGSLERRDYKRKKIRTICFTQNIKSEFLEDIKDTVYKFSAYFDKAPAERIITPSGDIYKKQPNDCWSANIYSEDLLNYFIDQVSDGVKWHALDKSIPRWVMGLDPSLLNIFLNALVSGDGSFGYTGHSNNFRYYTSSKKLATDIQEIVFKCGFSSNLIYRVREKDYKGRRKGEKYLSTEYMIHWSTAQDGTTPSTYNKINKEPYNGKVWCFEVPTGLFVTRRNGKLTIQGNSTGDKDFKIFTHNEVEVQRVGYNQGILDTSGDFQQLMKEIFIGLMVPSVIMDGSDTTYATGSVSLDVLRQRYMSFREKLAKWLRRKIFAPISELNEFYEFDGNGGKKLIIPEVEWNHMSLFDMSDYINHLMQLSNAPPAERKLSLQTLYRSLGIDYEDEKRKMRYEDIQAVIREKELQSLQQYSLSSLRALKPSDEIDEPEETALPGQSPYEEPVPGQEGGGMGGPGGGMGGLGGGGGGPILPSPGGPPPAPIGGGVKGPKPPGSGGNPPPGNVGIGGGGVPKPPPPS